MRQRFPCPRCGSENAVGQRFCGTCREQFDYRCRHCGATIDTTSKFCTGCGARLHWPEEQQPKPEQDTPEQTIASSKPTKPNTIQEGNWPYNIRAISKLTRRRSLEQIIEAYLENPLG